MGNKEETTAIQPKKCIGCEEVKPVTEFYRNPTGKPKAHCKVCMKEYERIRYAERKKTREIIQENKDFFQLGTTKADDHIRDLQKALNIAQKTIRALMDVIKEADLRDFKRGRIPA